MTTTTARASIFKAGIRCEVAQDLIGALIAHAAHELAQALDAQNPDAQRIAGLRVQQQQWRDRREALDHRDAAQN